MPKIIFTSRYLRDAPPEQLGNYVKYIGTREGVEKIDESKGHLPATAAQKKLIAQLLRDLPKARAMLEYEDYRLHPTRRIYFHGPGMESGSVVETGKLCGLSGQPSPCGADRRAWTVHRCREAGGDCQSAGGGEST